MIIRHRATHDSKIETAEPEVGWSRAINEIDLATLDSIEQSL